MTETEREIAAILERVHADKADRIRPDTFINKDLGVDGDDAVDLLHEIQKKFEIDIDDFPLSDFFGPESMSILTIFSEIFRRIVRGESLSSNLRPLSIRELAEYVDRKKGR